MAKVGFLGLLDFQQPIQHFQTKIRPKGNQIRFFKLLFMYSQDYQFPFNFTMYQVFNWQQPQLVLPQAVQAQEFYFIEPIGGPTNSKSSKENEANRPLNHQNEPHLCPHQQQCSRIRKHKTQSRKFNQKEDRNVYSNILRSFFKFLSSESSKQTHGKMEKKYKFSFSFEEFKQWLSEYGINHRNYIRMVTLKKVLTDGSGHKSLALLIHLFYYLENFSRNHFLTSLKLKQGTKALILQNIREIRKQLSKYYSAQLENSNATQASEK